MSFDYISDMEELKKNSKRLCFADKRSKNLCDYIMKELCDSIIALNQRVKELENG